MILLVRRTGPMPPTAQGIEPSSGCTVTDLVSRAYLEPLEAIEEAVKKPNVKSSNIAPDQVCYSMDLERPRKFLAPKMFLLSCERFGPLSAENDPLIISIIPPFSANTCH